MPLYMRPFACGCYCVSLGQILRRGITRLTGIPGGGDDVCVCLYVCVFAVLDIVNILDLFLPFVIIHTVPSLGLFIPSHPSVLLRSSLA